MKVYGSLERASLEVVANLGALPAVGVTGRVVFVASVKLAYIDNGTLWVPMGGGAGGGAGGTWSPGDAGAVEASENGEKIFLFSSEDRGVQTLNLFLRIPQGYTAGQQIKAYLGAYSPSNTGTFFLKTLTTLVRKEVDAISSVTNQYSSTNAALTNTVVDMLREVEFDLTDTSGEINGIAVSAGDVIKIELSRDNTDTDSAEIRVIPSSTEVKFG